jgi:endonuclease/exonuclease/phosphatase family metal-dependent hydrolase
VSPAAPGTLRVVQLNVGSLLEPGWPERRHEVVAWLDALDPDVACLQEVWQSDTEANTGGWIAEHLGRHWCFGGHPTVLRDDPSLRFGSVVLSRWPIDATSCTRLPVGPDASPLVAGIASELLHARTAGLDVFSTHLTAAPTDGRHRRLQVVALDAEVRRVRGDADARPAVGRRRPGMPPILCGDFNAEPDSDEIRFLCGLTDLDGTAAWWQDAWRVAGTGPGLTQDWTVAPLAAGYNVPRKRIDYVFVGDPFLRRGDAGRVLSARLAFDEPRTGVIASDHLGLVVEVVWPDRPT